ncbi:serine/threonine-protein kinase [Streptomyces sp. NPDC013953]|uniref:serine/threonine-protein kinase n=1 Tax=Streptomyces sp. NPDC013953 TaxID=3364868 RepID=UPI0036FE1920
MTGARVEELRGDDPRQLGRYRLLGRLGSGGMGRVYLGRTRGGRLVAVKTLLAEGVVEATDRRRFAREVALAQRVSSVHTAQVLDADATAGRPWMAIEYIAAPSLAELVGAKGVLQASAVRWVAAGTAEALVTLHRMGIVHRDVKPQNVLLPLDGPRLIDFGISHASDLTRTQLTLGTIAFTSPEQARGEESTAAADVYSLGATLFHLAVGRPPYPLDGDTLRLLSRVQRADLDLGGLSKELAPLIRPCLAPDPAARPEPVEVLEQFTASLSGLPNTPSGSRWLPPRWTELIRAYESQGRRFQETGEAEGPTVDQRTSALPPPDPTRVLPEERARRAERARAAQASMAAALAAQEEQLRRAGAARKPSAASSASTPAPPLSSPAPASAPAAGRVDGGWFGLILLAVVVFFIYQANAEDSGSTGSGSSSPRSTYDSSYGSNSRHASAPTPAPDAVDLAFRAVDSGDCLTAYDDGHESWSTRTPQTVGCSAANAYLRVTSASEGIDFANCPSGNGRSYWYHSGSRYSFATTLCVERQFRKGQCFVANRSGRTITASRPLNLWNCDATEVPHGFNTVLQITGYHKARTFYPAGYCSRSRDDRNIYWTYEVDGGRNVLCTTAV